MGLLLLCAANQWLAPALHGVDACSSHKEHYSLPQYAHEVRVAMDYTTMMHTLCRITFYLFPPALLKCSQVIIGCHCCYNLRALLVLFHVAATDSWQCNATE